MVDSEPGKSFGFAVVNGGKDVNTWRYQLAPSGDGTEAESFSWPRSAPRLLGGVGRWRAQELNGMRETLERVEAGAETGESAGAS